MQRFQTLAERGSRRIGDGFRTGQLAKAFKLVGDIGHFVGLRNVDGEAQRFQFFNLCHVVAALPGNHQIRLERGNCFHVDARIAADAWHFLGGRRVIAVFDGADQLVASARSIEAFGCMWGKGNNALGGGFETNFLAGIILEDQFGLRLVKIESVTVKTPENA